MVNQTKNLHSSTITNILLAFIAILLIVQLVMSSLVQAKSVEQEKLTAKEHEAYIAKIEQYSLENSNAIDDLFNDYKRDRDFHTEKEENYLLKQIIVGDEYIIHGLMFLARQNIQILDCLAQLK